MAELVAAIGLACVLEGALYALFPNGMRRMMIMVLATPPSRLRVMGLILAATGLMIVWIARA